ncbi:hypothetical protein AB0G15_05690 [Streptosporangium sp. NPDC023825]|uniref:hypothetical protein n=1 Tax=Streptosporangium sp. NPDC023825 TaxID=3154909 RepID=UPI00341A22FD
MTTRKSPLILHVVAHGKDVNGVTANAIGQGFAFFGRDATLEIVSGKVIKMHDAAEYTANVEVQQVFRKEDSE